MCTHIHSNWILCVASHSIISITHDYKYAIVALHLYWVEYLDEMRQRRAGSTDLNDLSFDSASFAYDVHKFRMVVYVTAK